MEGGDLPSPLRLLLVGEAGCAVGSLSRCLLCNEETTRISVCLAVCLGHGVKLGRPEKRDSVPDSDSDAIRAKRRLLLGRRANRNAGVRMPAVGRAGGQLPFSDRADEGAH